MDDAFVYQSMLTCIGNKRKLVTHIREMIDDIRKTLQKDKLAFLDGFSGSGVVSRAVIDLLDTLYVNDMEYYSTLMAKCFFEKPSEQDIPIIQSHIQEMNRLATHGPWISGIIAHNYCPKDTHNPQLHERCFYTHENGQIIDTLRAYIETVDPHLQPYLLAPLLIKASIHTNTAGVFKGFYKDTRTGIGAFGGTSGNAISRITKPIQVESPIWHDAPLTTHVFQTDINSLIQELPDTLDVIYLDPPYNQHPYSSNYFMLNLIAKNIIPDKTSKVSGIPSQWTRSDYNYHNKAVAAMKELLHYCVQKSSYVLLSYNNEGTITLQDWEQIFEPYQVTKKGILYDAYRGSRNLHNRAGKVTEILYMIRSR